MNTNVTADPQALREELALHEPVDLRSPVFQRFVIRLSERMDFDIPREDYAKLATLAGCSNYVSRYRGQN